MNDDQRFVYTQYRIQTQEFETNKRNCIKALSILKRNIRDRVSWRRICLVISSKTNINCHII